MNPIEDDEAHVPDGSESAVEAWVRYGDEIGWVRSRTQYSAIDSAGNPVPWYTYPAISFLARCIKPHFTVFEFGTGNSTLWWASRVKSVISVEHDKKWAEAMKPQIPSNVVYSWFPHKNSDAYSRSIQATGQLFDVIVVDGKDRYNCTVNSLQSLAPSGVFVWDNAEVPHYQPLFDDLSRKGFRRLPFVGNGPIAARTWETSIFYRTDNCLGV